MLQLRFEREIPCHPDVAWSMVAEPKRVNLWSPARVYSVDGGDGGYPSGVGALRRVHLPGVGRDLHEVVVVAEPGKRFTYMVYGGAPFRNHRADIRLTPTETGTHIDWRLDAEFYSRVTEFLAKRTFVEGMELGLDLMADSAPGLAPLPVPPYRALTDDADLAAMIEGVDTLRLEIQEMADGFAAVDDGRGWYARVVEWQLAGDVDAVRQRVFQHPAWVLRVLLESGRIYLGNLKAHLRRDRANVEGHWQRAFDEMEGLWSGRGSPLDAIGRGLAIGRRTRAEEDIPRVIGSIYTERYAGRCDFVRFRGDYLSMANLHHQAASRFLSRVPHERWPLKARASYAIRAQTTLDHFLDWCPDDIAELRSLAFERGRRLVSRPGG